MYNINVKKILNKLTISASVMLFLMLSIVTKVSAADCVATGGRICNPIKQDSLTGLLKTVLEEAIKIGIPVIALAIIYSGFLFVAARGKPEEITKAKDALLYSLIGAAILIGAWAIAQLVSNTVLSL